MGKHFSALTMFQQWLLAADTQSISVCLVADSLHPTLERHLLLICGASTSTAEPSPSPLMLTPLCWGRRHARSAEPGPSLDLRGASRCGPGLLGYAPLAALWGCVERGGGQVGGGGVQACGRRWRRRLCAGWCATEGTSVWVREGARVLPGAAGYISRQHGQSRQ
jgi:hypothetical protein